MLRIVPVTQAEAKAFIKQHHRHHKPPVGSVFQIAVAKADNICGVAVEDVTELMKELNQ